MRRALRIGTYSSLNLYFLSNLTSADTNGTLLGYCELPYTDTTACSAPGIPSSCTKTVTAPADYRNDGCNVFAGTMPGGDLEDYNLGMSAVHEVGHWFGLLHPFQDTTCAKGDPGDYIDDTPQEKAPTDGCPVGKDSCPDSPGPDPIWNYMDYSFDSWYVLNSRRFLTSHRLLS